ncbi:FAD/NAD(P)-binding domain-containing protein, partial [Atractiella rhizophila]
YSLSTELNPNWSSQYATQPEILAYWRKIYEKYKISRFVTFNTTFLKAVYHTSPLPYYEVTLLSSSGQPFKTTCHVLISTVGGFSVPLMTPANLPITGLENFRGEMFHSAAWNWKVDLKGKRVAAIGNGCSASQFVAEIGKEEWGLEWLGNWVRTPNWYMDRDQFKYSGFSKWFLRNVPGANRAWRIFLWGSRDVAWPVWVLDRHLLRNYAEWQARRYMKKTAPKEYLDWLIPKYPFGCKRVILDPGYLEVLHRPNVELVTNPIDHVTEDSIVNKDGTETKVDVIILGTGFDVAGAGTGLDIIGRNGKRLIDQWNEEGGPQAYLGTTVKNFPNVYFILGPNVATGHTSALTSIECQIGYIVQMVGAMVNYRAEAFEVKAEAENNYNGDLRRRLKNSVWQGGCSTYYKSKDSHGSKTVATFPGPVAKYWWLTKTPVWRDYIQVGGKQSVAQAKRVKKILFSLFFALSALLVGFLQARGQLSNLISA